MDRKYLAGFFDGVGNILIYKRRDKRARKGFTYNLTVSMIRVDRGMLREIKRICKSRIVIVSKKKDICRIQIQNLQGAWNFLGYIKDDLITKKRLAKQALKYCSSRIKRGYSDREITIVKKIMRMRR